MIDPDCVRLYVVIETWCYSEDTPDVRAAEPKMVYFTLDKKLASKESARLNRIAKKEGDGIDGGREYSYTWRELDVETSSAVYDTDDCDSDE